MGSERVFDSFAAGLAATLHHAAEVIAALVSHTRDMGALPPVLEDEAGRAIGHLAGYAEMLRERVKGVDDGGDEGGVH